MRTTEQLALCAPPLGPPPCAVPYLRQLPLAQEQQADELSCTAVLWGRRTLLTCGVPEGGTLNQQGLLTLCVSVVRPWGRVVWSDTLGRVAVKGLCKCD